MKQVTFYTHAKAQVEVHFPEGYTVCIWCPFCVKDPTNGVRKVCFLTRELLVYEEFCRGSQCPLVLDGEQHGKP